MARPREALASYDKLEGAMFTASNALIDAAQHHANAVDAIHDLVGVRGHEPAKAAGPGG